MRFELPFKSSQIFLRSTIFNFLRDNDDNEEDDVESEERLQSLMMMFECCRFVLAALKKNRCIRLAKNEII